MPPATIQINMQIMHEALLSPDPGASTIISLPSPRERCLSREGSSIYFEPSIKEMRVYYALGFLLVGPLGDLIIPDSCQRHLGGE